MNGEIYNHQELRKEFPDYEFLTQSDCEVILALYRKYGKDFIEKLNGIFAFSLYDIENDIYLIARDHMGICPLYQGWDKHGNYYVASELKALEAFCNKLRLFTRAFCIQQRRTKNSTMVQKRLGRFENVKTMKPALLPLEKV